jgi:ribosome-binding factor A
LEMKYRRFRMQDLFREEISEIIQREIKDPGIGFITVLDVKITEDLRVAKVLYSVYGSEDEKLRTVEALRRARGYIKHLLGTRVKVKFMPDIVFELDTGQEKSDRIDELLKKVGAERTTHVSED